MEDNAQAGLSSQSARPATMNPLAPAEKIQRLEQKHVELITQLDVLSERLELVLAGEKNDEIPNDE